ncbi:MAG TPA: hypothetical protein VG267_15100 [Terracidiphilus sp.]|nr:hypothetical protein [Terracidiphilus sp.]
MATKTASSQHVYTLSGGQRVFNSILGLGGFAAAALFLWTGVSEADNRVVAIVSAVIFLFLGCYLLARGFRSRIVIDGVRIAIRDPFREHCADLAAIEGYRTLNSRYGSFMQLILKEDSGKITLSNSFATDDDFRAWLAQVPDLDLRDREALLQEIQQDAELGSTPDERLAALAGARRVNFALIGASLLLAAGMIFRSDSLRGPAAALLACAPIAILLLAQRSPLLYAVMKGKQDPRTDLGGTLLISAAALFFEMVKANFVTLQNLLYYSVLVCVVVLVAYFATVRRSLNLPLLSLVVVLLFWSGFYAFGLVGTLDTVFDRSQPTAYVVPVTGKHVTRSRSTDYYLELAPWGPRQTQNSLSVSSSVYREFNPGDSICLALHPGWLRIAWYTPISCPAKP